MKVDHVQMYFFTEIYIPFDMCEGTKLDSYDIHILKWIVFWNK